MPSLGATSTATASSMPPTGRSFLPIANKSFTGQSPVAAYLGGDLNGDLVNDFRDFRLFQHDFVAVNGQAAFAALSGANIPEPSTLVLAAVGLAGLALCRGYRKTVLLFVGQQFVLFRFSVPTSQRRPRPRASLLRQTLT